MGNSCSDIVSLCHSTELASVETDPIDQSTLEFVTQTYKNGAVYQGQIDPRGMRHGEGTFTYRQPTGAEYKGQWRDDKCHGHGSFKDGDSTYIGQWYQGQKHGIGEEKWEGENTIYKGEYKMGEKSGQGEYKWEDGSSYKGQFAGDDICGFGVYTDQDGVYTGDFKNSMHHGVGSYAATDGSKYQGQWLEGEKDGEGTMSWPDGKKYEGGWRGGVQHGKGNFTNRKGTTTVFYFDGVKCKDEAELNQMIASAPRNEKNK